MKIQELLKNAGYEIDRREAILLMAHALNKPEAYIVANNDFNMPVKTEVKFNKMVADRVKKKPIAYILGKQPFCGLEFKVNKNVLIPRPETEQLVEMVAKNALSPESRSAPRPISRAITHEAKTERREKGNQVDKKTDPQRNVVIVDIGTGSGCIACSLKTKLNNATVIASDNSPAILSVVKHNDKKLSTGIKVIHSNLFSGQLLKTVQLEIKRAEKVDLHIIANLPYLPYSDKVDMQKDVVAFEPNCALFADDDGMALIKKCIQQLEKFLLPYSRHILIWTLYFEIDPRQKNVLQSFAKRIFPKSRVNIKKDLSGQDRFLIITNRD